MRLWRAETAFSSWVRNSLMAHLPAEAMMRRGSAAVKRASSAPPLKPRPYIRVGPAGAAPGGAAGGPGFGEPGGPGEGTGGAGGREPTASCVGEDGAPGGR